MEISLSEVLGPIISIIVCIATICFSQMSNKKALEHQQRNHIENLNLSEKKYTEQLAINAENERLKYLPYIYLVPKQEYQVNRFISKMIKLDDSHAYSIPFDIINKGAGTAFFIELKLLNDNNNTPKSNNVAIATNQVFENQVDILGVRAPIDTEILPVNDSAEFCLYLSALSEDSLTIDPISEIHWEFEITFCDIQERKYSQKYSFITSTTNNCITRIYSAMPQLLDPPESI